MLNGEESGQGMVEYGLVLVLISLALVFTLSSLGSNTVKVMYDKIKEAILNLEVN